MRTSGRFDDPDILHAIETIEHSARSQAQLLEDLLDVSRVIRVKLVLDVRPVEIGQLIENAMEPVRASADSKSIQLLLHLDRLRVILS